MSHTPFMRRALALARRGRTSPNPKVGAVIVRDGEIVGEGYHPCAGEPHAEIFALKDAGDKARGAVMYVTLEPCCHHGRTPPCVDAVIKAGIGHVVAAMADPDARVACKGFDRLREAAIEVTVGVCEAEARALNEAYIKHRTTGMPFVILKSAMSLDGRIATRTGDSKWITNERSRAFAHKIRADVDAIIVGSGTARADNPSLTARVGKKTYYPARVIVTQSGNVPADLKMFGQPGECIIAAGPDANATSLRKLEQTGARIISLSGCGGRTSLADLMRQLATAGKLSVLIEGGGEVAASALREQVVDKVIYFYSPKIIGGRDAVASVGGIGVENVSQCVSLDSTRIRRFGQDFAIEGYVKYPED